MGTIYTLQVKYQHLENVYMWGRNKSKDLMTCSVIALVSVREGENGDSLSENTILGINGGDLSGVV